MGEQKVTTKTGLQAAAERAEKFLAQVADISSLAAKPEHFMALRVELYQLLKSVDAALPLYNRAVEQDKAGKL